MLQRGFHIGRYQVNHRLGAGGMGEVWLAQGKEGPVVIKTMLPELMDQPKLVDLFLKEARIAALVKSPHVVQLLEVEAAGSTSFLVLEYVRGLSLSRLLGLYGGAVPAEIAIEVAAQAALGIADIHAQHDASGDPLGIVHRDVSPGNILVSDAGLVKLTDFGIAKIRDTTMHSSTTMGSVKGKVAYMSPEQARGEEVGPASDIFSLGVVLYRMLTGELPYDGTSSDLRLLQTVSAGAPKKLRDADPHLPEALLAIADRAMATDPKDRFATARELHAALAPLSTGDGRGRLRAWTEPLTARATAMPAPTSGPFDSTATVSERKKPKATARRRTLWAAIAVGGAAVLGALAFLALRPAAPPVSIAPAPVAATPVPTPAPPIASTVATPTPTPAPIPPKPVVERRHTPAAPQRRVRLETTPPCDVYLGAEHLGRSPVLVPVPMRAKGVRIRLVSRALGISYEHPFAPAEGQTSVRIEVPKGTLHLRIDPYSEATLDGTALGEGPFQVLDVYAGRHDLQVFNRDLNVRRRLQIDVAPGEHKIYRLKLP